MEEAPENGKESSHSVHANGTNYQTPRYNTGNMEMQNRTISCDHTAQFVSTHNVQGSFGNDPPTF